MLLFWAADIMHSSGLQVKTSDILNMKLLLTVFLLLLPVNQAGKQYVTIENLKDWITYLSSDEMKGRKNGSQEMRIAANWISERFIQFGLSPLAFNDGFIKEYTYSSRSGNVNERNVIGYIEGSDPLLKDEYIILSAHFDHMGTVKGNPADSVYNGADDNAAGTSTLIAIAKYIRESGAKPGRSIIFAAFSGEEQGMRGSRNFVSNLPVPAEKIYANLNFEMTGHSEELGAGKYYMTGCLLSNLDEIVGSYIDEPGIELIDTLPVANMLFNASDNIAFSKMSVADDITTGIPSGTFATSTLAPHVHSLDDEASFFDFSNMATLVNHFGKVVLRLSDEKKKVIWTDSKWRRPGEK